MKFEDSYCAYSKIHNDVHLHYHDNIYGFPQTNDQKLFQWLVLEINQAGLNWDLILKKKENFKNSFHQFDIQKVANYGTTDINRLLKDSGIIKNKLKINATIYNAQKILDLQNEFGSFKNWLDLNSHFSKEEWIKCFKKMFKFTGNEITNEFLMCTGYLKGAHHPDCPIHKKIIQLHPKWMDKE